MKNNKKIVVITSILLLSMFGAFLLPITKATETYTTTEEIEDFSCIDDTYVYSGWNYMNYGDSPLLTVGYDIDYTLETEGYVALFKFDLTNRPKNYIKAEVVLTFNDYGMNILIPAYLSNNSWNEETATFEELGYMADFPPITLPFSFNSHVIFGIGFIDVTYNIDITEYSEFQFVSFYLAMSYHSSDFEEDISTIYSKEYPDESVRPKIIWTVEHNLVLLQTNELLFLISLSLGLIAGLVIICVIIILYKRKSKI